MVVVAGKSGVGCTELLSTIEKVGHQQNLYALPTGRFFLPLLSLPLPSLPLALPLRGSRHLFSAVLLCTSLDIFISFIIITYSFFPRRPPTVGLRSRRGCGA